MLKYSGLSDNDLRYAVNSFKASYNPDDDHVQLSQKLQEVIEKKDAKLISKYKMDRNNYKVLPREDKIRRQRHISEIDMGVFMSTFFSKKFFNNPPLKVSFKRKDIKEFLWISVYINEHNDVMFNALLQLVNNDYAYVNTVLHDDETLHCEQTVVTPHYLDAVKAMDDVTYFWFVQKTETEEELKAPRDLRIRRNHKFKARKIIYVMLKLHEAMLRNQFMEIETIGDAKREVDHLHDVKELYLVHLHMHDNTMSHIFYQNMRGQYVLLNFMVTPCHCNPEKKGMMLKMIKSYVANSHEEIVQQAMNGHIYKEYLEYTKPV